MTPNRPREAVFEPMREEEAEEETLGDDEEADDKCFLCWEAPREVRGELCDHGVILCIYCADQIWNSPKVGIEADGGHGFAGCPRCPLCHLPWPSPVDN